MLTRKQLEAKQSLFEAYYSWRTDTLALLDSFQPSQNAEDVDMVRTFFLKVDGLYKLLECMEDEDEVRAIVNEAAVLRDAITPVTCRLIDLRHTQQSTLNK